MRGKFISIEGIDGAGKSTHIPFILDLLRGYGAPDVVSVREPGGTVIGESLRAMVLHTKMHLETEALLMFASRRELISHHIEPALSRGDWVFSDRFADSSFAYQTGGRGLPREKLEILELWVCGTLEPDLTLLFDLPLEIARARLDATREQDKFEQEKADFFFNTRTEYLRRAAQFAHRFRFVDSSRPIEDCQTQIKSHLDEWHDKNQKVNDDKSKI